MFGSESATVVIGDINVAEADIVGRARKIHHCQARIGERAGEWIVSTSRDEQSTVSHPVSNHPENIRAVGIRFDEKQNGMRVEGSQSASNAAYQTTEEGVAEQVALTRLGVGFRIRT